MDHSLSTAWPGQTRLRDIGTSASLQHRSMMTCLPAFIQPKQRLASRGRAWQQAREAWQAQSTGADVGRTAGPAIFRLGVAIDDACAPHWLATVL
jgi:hypothetical protein